MGTYDCGFRHGDWDLLGYLIPWSRPVKLVMAEGIMLTMAGLFLGLLTGFGLTRFLSSLLWGINALDPWTFAVVSLFLLAVGAAACYMPAKKAASLDPMVALRHD